MCSSGNSSLGVQLAPTLLAPVGDIVFLSTPSVSIVNVYLPLASAVKMCEAV
jgi:hypothetical protein